MSKQTCEKMSKTRTGDKFINNGIEQKMIKLNDGKIPNEYLELGYKLGKLPLNDDIKEKISISLKGKKKPPRTEEHKRKFNQSRLKSLDVVRGSKWITNGIEQRRLKESDSIPEGWRYGSFITKHLKQCIILTKEDIYEKIK